MYRKIVWCYVFILTLLDISLNTKLSAQGKSHGVTVHDSLIEGITFQEWGKDSVEEGASRGGGRGVSPGALALSPPALEFGRAALAAAHALTVTLTNTANTTMHLASVAGTTPDFHASFFESKTLPPQANTTFSVVYLGRREGPVSAHLYIHTSLGVHKYPVSAIGVASEWGVWPLVGVRVPLNATVEPLLTMHNPTDQTIQVSEVYSSGSWLGLALPDGAAAAPRAAWALPPGATRALVRLRLAPPPAAPHAPHSPHAAHAPLTAYVRIKANMTGGGLVVCVEARAAAAGEFASPLQLRLRARGSRDPAGRFDIALGNSAAAGVALDASVWAARCSAAPPAAPAPPHAGPAAHNGENRGAHNGNGAKSEGVYVSLSRTHLEPHEPLTHAAQLTFDYAKMWAGAGAGAQAAAGAEGAWCGGWVSLGRAAVPYSVRVLPGTLALTPPEMHFVTSSEEEALRPREVRVRNEFPVAVHVARVDFEPEVEQYFEVQQWGGTVAAGATAGVARVRLRPAALGEVVRAQIVMRTNVSDYALPLLVYSGRLDIEWQWPNSADGTLRLGALGASSTRRVAAWLHNGGVAPLCALELAAALAGATFHLPDCPEPQRGEEPASCRCVAAGARLAARLTLVAPARAGALAGRVWVRAARPGAWGVGTRSASCARRVELAALPGRLAARPLALQPAAPYAWSSAPLVLESTMAQSMRMVDVTLPPDNPALSYEAEGAEGAGEVSFGRHAVGRVVFAPERLCAPRCYTGLEPASPEGAAWERRGDWPDAAALRADAALQAERRARFEREAPRRNVSLYAHTTHVVQIPVWGAVGAQWPRLAASAGDAGLAGVGGAAPLRVRVRNPSRSHALLVQPVVDEPMALAETAVPAACRAESCRPARAAFRLLDWRATSGAVRTWRALAPAVPAGPAPANLSALATLLLAPDAELELRLSFAPLEPAPLTAYLYLRNNLTILEAVQLSGRGAYPSFEIGGRRPGTTSPLLFEVSECAEAGAGAGAAAGGSVRRTLLARNTGRVRVRLREWRVAGEPCGARGFRVAPCAALSLAPNESRPITISFTADWTLARVTATLSLRSELGRATFPLAAVAPARLLPRCAGAAPRPPWEAALRAAGCLAALAALALVLAAAALDAERELRRARAARPPPAARQPLDLRALASEPQAPPQPVPRRPPPRRRRPPRPPVDPAAERRAFERWRHDVLGTQDDDERSSEDNEQPKRSSTEDDTAPLLEAEVGDDPPAATDGYEADPETEDRPQGSGDDDAASTGSGSTTASSSSPVADVDEADDGDEHEDAPHERPPPESAESPTTPPRAPPADAAARPSRPRRDAADTPRRGDRSKTFDSGERSRPAVAKHHARKDKAGKRRERPAATPPRSPPPRAEPRGAGGAGGAVGAGGGGAGGALRWGASWSSVVAARAPAAQLAPIGSDVRRRAEPAPPDVSLFYFNGEHAPPAPLPAPREPDFAWRASPHAERPQYSPARDFLEEPGVGVGVGAAGAFAAPPLSSSVWGGALEPAAWLWGGSALAEPVRPPPGFGPARAARPYDPFRSLASIWAPGARDWRDPDAPDEPPH